MRTWGGLRERITYANVVATLALLLALCGGAVAASQLAKNSVGPKQLKKNSVTSVKIKKNAVNGSKVKDGSLTGADLQDGAITGPKIADGAITPAKLSVRPGRRRARPDLPQPDRRLHQRGGAVPGRGVRFGDHLRLQDQLRKERL